MYWARGRYPPVSLMTHASRSASISSSPALLDGGAAVAAASVTSFVTVVNGSAESRIQVSVNTLLGATLQNGAWIGLQDMLADRVRGTLVPPVKTHRWNIQDLELRGCGSHRGRRQFGDFVADLISDEATAGTQRRPDRGDNT